MSKINRKNGYSLVEVVIALSVIVIVSVSALSISLSSVATKVNAINKSHAQSFADNVWESFKAADTEENFISFIAFSEGVDKADITATNGENGNTVYTYSSEKHKFTADITVSYPQDARPELKISVADKDGDEIILLEYKKGA